MKHIAGTITMYARCQRQILRSRPSSDKVISIISPH